MDGTAELIISAARRPAVLGGFGSLVMVGSSARPPSPRRCTFGMNVKLLRHLVQVITFTHPRAGGVDAIHQPFPGDGSQTEAKCSVLSLDPDQLSGLHQEDQEPLTVGGTHVTCSHDTLLQFWPTCKHLHPCKVVIHRQEIVRGSEESRCSSIWKGRSGGGSASDQEAQHTQLEITEPTEQLEEVEVQEWVGGVSVDHPAGGAAAQRG